DGTPLDADAQIGSVTVGGDWIASSIAAGVQPGPSGFGSDTDVAITGSGTTDRAGIVSKIGSVKISGETLGTPNSISGTDHFGFVAQELDSVKIAGKQITTLGGPGAVPVGLTNDLAVLQVAL